MIKPLQKPRDSRWRRYAEFLRKNGRRPELGHYKEKSLYTWYNSNLSKLDNGQLDKDQELSFSKLADNGETYQFYVVNREKSLSKLALFGRDTDLIGKEIDGEDSIHFAEACKIYIDFCNRMERHPRLHVKEEMNIAKWYLKTKDAFFNSRLTDQEMHTFDQLLQSTKQYKNDNVINHVSRLHEENLNKGERNEILNADNGTGSHVGARQRNWFEMCNKYSKYLDDNNKVPTQNGDRNLYDWIYRQKKLLAEGDIEDDRKAILGKLLAKIDDVRKNQVEEPDIRKERYNSGKERISLEDKHANAIKAAKPKKNARKSVKRDDLWNQKWQAYMDYMKKNHLCPSRYYAEDIVLFSWFKHNKMLFSKGKMHEDRIAKFKQLFGEAKELQSKNKDIINADNRKEFHIRARQRNWFEMCERYSKYLDDNKKIPKQNGDRQLYSWMFRQKRHLAEGDIKDNRKATLEKLLAKIEDVREYQVDEANKKKERKQSRKEEISLDGKHAVATKTTNPKKNEHKAVKQDDLWNRKWQAYRDFMMKNQRCPSKHHAEELVLFDWFKHSKKLLKRGLMKAERIAKFKQLLSEAENLPRFNQFNYVDTSLKS